MHQPSRATVATILLAILLFLLPVLYFLSFGPAMWLVNKGYASTGPDSWVYTLYWPIEELCSAIPVLNDVKHWYLLLWI